MSDRVGVMNQGKILQTGSPKEIYDKPSSIFVAKFIGECNFIPIYPTDSKGEFTTAYLPGGKAIDVPTKQLLNIKGNPQIMLRPERAKLNLNWEDSLISASLKRVVYFGTDTIYHLRVDVDQNEELELLVRSQNVQTDDMVRFSEGQIVGFDFDFLNLQIVDG